MVRIEQAGDGPVCTLQGHWAVGNPDAFMTKIHCPWSTLQAVSSGECRGTEVYGAYHLHFAGMVGDGDWEEAGVLSIHMNKIDTLIRLKGRKPHPLPVKQILRHGEGDPWSIGRKRCVSHQVAFHGSTT